MIEYIGGILKVPLKVLTQVDWVQFLFELLQPGFTLKQSDFRVMRLSFEKSNINLHKLKLVSHLTLKNGSLS